MRKLAFQCHAAARDAFDLQAKAIGQAARAARACSGAISGLPNTASFHPERDPAHTRSYEAG